jgi:hypothetical protein
MFLATLTKAEKKRYDLSIYHYGLFHQIIRRKKAVSKRKFFCLMQNFYVTRERLKISWNKISSKTGRVGIICIAAGDINLP